MSDGPLVETARVVAGRGDIVEIEINRTTDCAACGLCRSAQGGVMRVTVRSAGRLDVGQKVRVTFPYRSRWRAIIFVFAIPLGLFLTVGICVGVVAQVLSWPALVGSVGAVIAAFAGLAGGLTIGMMNDRRFRKRLLERTTVEPLEEQ